MNIYGLVSSSQAIFKESGHCNFEGFSAKEWRYLTALVHQQPEVMHTHCKKLCDFTGMRIILNKYSCSLWMGAVHEEHGFHIPQLRE